MGKQLHAYEILGTRLVIGHSGFVSSVAWLGFVVWTVLQLWGLRFRVADQDRRVTGVYERPRLNASAGSSNRSTSHAGSGTFVVPFSDFGDRFHVRAGFCFSQSEFSAGSRLRSTCWGTWQVEGWSGRCLAR